MMKEAKPFTLNLFPSATSASAVKIILLLINAGAEVAERKRFRIRESIPNPSIRDQEVDPTASHMGQGVIPLPLSAPPAFRLPLDLAEYVAPAALFYA